MITEYYQLAGIDKVAVVFSIIGENVAVKLLKDLDETDVQRIRARSREMEQVSTALKKQIMDEFYLSVISQKLKSESEPESKKPFDFIEELADEQLIALLEVEEPSIIAIALAQVSAERQMKVLTRLSPEVKGNVLMKLGSLNNVPLEGIVNVASQLRTKSLYLPKAVEFTRSGGKDVADILGQMTPFEEEQYLDTIAREDPELAAEIKKYHLTFDDILASFPENLLRDLMNSVELDAIAMALKGRSQDQVDKILENLPQKKQAMYEPVEGAVAKNDVDKAQKSIVDAARQMEKDGRFSLEEVLGSAEMVD
jgi:flagellar motor switch protein FliG|tara:strand:- start:337 stop:1269 length:933 start_codon:yes stop_codon:yes gene_type:complete